MIETSAPIYYCQKRILREAQMVSLANMKQRVATAQAILKASELSCRNRDIRIMGFLEKIEEIISHKQQQICDLKLERDRALDEVRHLTDLLNVVLVRAEDLQTRDQAMGLDEMEKLMDRLNRVGATELQP